MKINKDVFNRSFIDCFEFGFILNKEAIFKLTLNSSLFYMDKNQFNKDALDYDITQVEVKGYD